MPPSVARLEVEVSGPKHEPVRLDGGVELLLHDARLDPHAPRGHVDRSDRVHVAREVEHQAAPARGLAGEARAAAARDDRHAEAPGDAHRGRDVVRVARERDRERLDREHARVGRVQMPRVGVGAHVPCQLPLQGGRKLLHDHDTCPLARV